MSKPTARNRLPSDSSAESFKAAGCYNKPRQDGDPFGSKADCPGCILSYIEQTPLVLDSCPADERYYRGDGLKLGGCVGGFIVLSGGGAGDLPNWQVKRCAGPRDQIVGTIFPSKKGVRMTAQRQEDRARSAAPLLGRQKPPFLSDRCSDFC